MRKTCNFCQISMNRHYHSGHKRAHQRKLIFIICSLFAILGIGAPKVVLAATYYVSNAGNDSNPGTQAQPWRTIQKAANTINGGDTAIVADGNYSAFAVTRSGSSGNYIYIKAQNDQGAVINTSLSYGCPSCGSNPAEGGGGFNTGIRISASYVKIEGFKMDGVVQDAYDSPIKICGGSDHVTINRNYLYNVGNCGIYLYYCTTNCSVTNNYLTKVQKGLCITGSYHTVSGNEVNGVKQWTTSDADYMRFWGTGHTISNNYFHGTDFVNDILPQSNPDYAHVDCMQTWDTVGYPDTSTTDLLVEGNWCSEYNDSFMIIEGQHRKANNNLTIRNNIIYISAAPYTVWNYGSNNMHFYNNTYILPLDNNSCGGPMCDGFGDSTPVNCDFKNNIVYQGKGLTAGSCRYNATCTGSNNLLYRSDHTFYVGDPWVYPNDVLNLDPKFVDVANKNFHLQSGSPAINTGAMLSGFSTDKDGITRPQGSGWDIGAYKYGVSLSTPDPPKNLRIATP